MDGGGRITPAAVFGLSGSFGKYRGYTMEASGLRDRRLVLRHRNRFTCMLFPPLPALLVVSTLTRISRSLFDDTFAGIHQLAWFDWAILIPYFGILGILSI